MWQTLLFCAVIGYTLAVPTGTYHQEYSYKSSASSFRNNELQHKTDDQGYYKKDGDLEGRMKPRVDANSEHSEYVNPNLRRNQYGYDANLDMSSQGLLHAQGGAGSYGIDNLEEGIASSDRIVGSRNYLSNADSYGSGSYGSSGYHSSYNSAAGIQSIIHRLQQDFERDLQSHRWKDLYSQRTFNQAELERQLRQNLTDRLNTELLNQYGQQTIRNGMSYTISGGHVGSVANYDNQELDNMRLQLENNLLNRLRNQYNQYGSSGSSSRYESHSQSNTHYTYSSTTLRPMYSTLYPALPVYTTTFRPSYTNGISHSGYEVVNSNFRYTPVSSPQTISVICSNIQTQLDGSLNQVLDDIERKHFSSNSAYHLTNYDVLLNRLQDELRSNLTYLIEENLRRNYGSQIQRDGYFYSLGPNGQVSTDYNYSLRDLEALKAQVERNLLEKLTRQFNTYRTRYTSQSHSFSSNSNYNSYDEYSSTPRYVYPTAYTTPRYVYSTAYTTPRYIYSTPYTTVRSPYSSDLNNQYEILGGSRHSGYEIGGSSYNTGSYSGGTYSSGSLAQLQQQLQSELSRQLQAAISRDSSAYSSHSPQNYQTSLQHLQDELNRNVTRHLQEFSASASYSASGSYDNAQIENMRSQLMSALSNQLQQNLRQHFQSSSSYSAGSSGYRSVRGFGSNLGQYKSGGSVTIGEDCDESGMGSYRMKRSADILPLRNKRYSHDHSFGLNYESQNGPRQGSHAHPYQFGSGHHHSHSVQHEVLGQQEEELGQQQEDLGQQIEEIGQEVEDESEFSIPSQSIEPKSNKFQNYGQEQEEFEPLQTGHHQEKIGQIADDSDLTQQVEMEPLTSSNQAQQNIIGQEIDDEDLGQQVEVDSSLSGASYHHGGQELDNSDIESSSGFRKPNQQAHNVGEQYAAIDVGNHQINDKLLNGKQSHRPTSNEQEINNFDLGQQPESDDIGQVVDDYEISAIPSANLQTAGHHQSNYYSRPIVRPIANQKPKVQISQVGVTI